MAEEALRGRIADQFSGPEERADVWRAFALVFDTDRYLNLGYSPRLLPTLLGSSHRRLVDHLGDRLAESLPRTEGVRLLDVGCGRGGPAVRLADRYGFAVTGVDLVPYNVSRARQHARGVDAAFVVGDAAGLPVCDGSMGAATSVDALVYLPETAAVCAELSRALRSAGVLVVSDLLARSAPTDAERDALSAFADAWDLAPPVEVAEYGRLLAEAGFRDVEVTDVSAHSVGRFRRWTRLYLAVADGPFGRHFARLLRRYGLDPTAVDEQVRRAHAALPALRHVVVTARAP